MSRVARRGAAFAKRTTIARILAFILITTTIACLDKSASTRRTMPTQPDFFMEDDYTSGDCPDCSEPDTYTRNQILRAIVQISNDCPDIGSFLMDTYNRGSMFIHSNPNYWGKLCVLQILTPSFSKFCHP
jgi:hypothetical protein